MELPENFSAIEREQKAIAYFMDGYNCCQAVALAFSDIMGIDELAVKKITSGFGGGIARMREVCGAVSGMVMVAGFISPADNPADKEGRTANYALVQQFAEDFKAQKGSIICRELLGLRAGQQEGPQPSDRTPAYYHSRTCAANVGAAARIVAEYLLSR